ncbi:dephospho-CoA kinase [Ruegeria sp. 2205SS24-7]|uniref:dephospho-CoA kinase n=1 Tax=Ruegeria discodermiae TaxID=3064389 RepID=UPI0027418331|nr:dephospho-CoA kinase [Ruegeria sp. 2205SS24-7]MDP5219467.1 dephospho-CoA kinase [Ruegeria sp. 2205SS24-7]
MSFCLGLTGSIGMGKSTTAAMFVAEGCALWDADAAVHRLYDKGAAVAPIAARFPDAVDDGRVDRAALKRIITDNPAALKEIESIVHPLVAQDRAAFRQLAQADILVFDIPLLFETGGDAAMDAVACVTIPADLQRQRVLERGTMSEAQFEQIRAKQMQNDEKCARSDYVIITDTLDHARRQVTKIVGQIRTGLANA